MAEAQQNLANYLQNNLGRLSRSDLELLLTAQARGILTSEAYPPTTILADPVTWARSNATIVHPKRGRITFEPYSYQVEFLQQYNESRRIIVKARQIGFSQVFALEAMYTAITVPESTILLVSRSQDLAINLLRYCYLTYNRLIKVPSLIKSNESEMGFDNGSRIKSIPANRSTGRGFAANVVYLDEFAYAEYAEDIYQSVSPAVAQGGRMIIGSTPNGSGNLFFRLYHGDGFRKLSVPWWECPAYYTPEEKARGVPKEECEWHKRERPKYTARQWASEYECDFVKSGSGVFRRVIEAATARPQEKSNGIHAYTIGVDWGRSSDATVFAVIDVNTSEMVYMDRMTNTDYGLQVLRLKALAGKFKPNVILAEYNSMGGPLVEQLQRDGLPVRSFTTTAKSKAEIVDALALAFERGDIRILNDPTLITELQVYESEQLASGVRYSAPEGMHDDTVIALALGWHTVASRTVVTVGGKRIA